MSDDSVGESVGKVLFGGLVGFAIFFLAGFGPGGRGTRPGAGNGEGSLPSPPSPRRPADAQRLTFVMQAADSFRLRGADPATTYTLATLVARVRDGQRSDVTLVLRGDVAQRAIDDAIAQLKQQGLDVSTQDAITAPTVAGDRGRGYYQGAR